MFESMMNKLAFVAGQTAAEICFFSSKRLDETGRGLEYLGSKTRDASQSVLTTGIECLEWSETKRDPAKK
jgi:hypothetical protein